MRVARVVEADSLQAVLMVSTNGTGTGQVG